MIAELSWELSLKETIRTEGEIQGQRIEGEIISPRGRNTFQFLREKIC